MRNRRRKLALLSVAGIVALGLVALVSATGTGSSEAQHGAMQNCPQAGKWAISVWDGPDDTDTGQALATCAAVPVLAAYHLDPQTGGWLGWFRENPEPTVSNLQTLDNLQGVIALGSAGTGASAFSDAESTLLAAQDSTMHNCPQPGKWAISVWDGDDGTETGQALATCAAVPVLAAYHLHPETGGWSAWFRDDPDPPMSNLRTLDNMQGVMALGGTTTAVPTPIVNQTTHGVIGWDEVWRDEIRIIGDIIVEEGATLTIEPGTVVLIAANQDVDNLNDAPFDLQQGICNDPDDEIYGVHVGEPYRDEGHHISIKVDGTLHAVGTPEQMITITSDSPTPGIYDWNHFVFHHGTLSYAIVEYYRVLSPRNGTEVSHNILRHVGECGVCANSSAVVEHNTVSYTGHELVDMHHSSPVIRYNHLGPNPGGVGIVIDGGSPQIVGNTIEGCSHGIEFISPPDDPVIEGNTFLNNEEDIVHGY